MKKVLVVAALLATVLVAVLLLQLMPKGSITGRQVAELPDEAAFDYMLFFCSETDCLEELASMINSSRVDCAMYNFNQKLLEDAEGGEIRIVTNRDYKEERQFIRKSNGSGLMHNKFCIFNGSIVLTGSFNPGSSGKDRNNIVIIRSKQLAKNYESEFNELWGGVYGKGAKTANSRLKLNSTLIESYFCPEDSCADKVQDEIESASSSVYFMAYSFTHRGIANSLILKNTSGVDVRGVIDSSSAKDVYELLKAQGVSARIDDKKGVMHHKVFIIDGKIVITGSFNPTYSADERNDENLLIIHDSEVAARYMEEFERVSG